MLAFLLGVFLVLIAGIAVIVADLRVLEALTFAVVPASSESVG